jgi:hypothetical protein
MTNAPGPLRFLILIAASLMMLASVAVLIYGLDSWAIEHIPTLDGVDVEEGPTLDYIDTKYGLIALAALPLHEMDEAAQAGTIDPDFSPAARTLVRITALTDWAPELERAAAALNEDAVALLTAIETGDVEEVKGPASDAHEHVHDFTEQGWLIIDPVEEEVAGGHEAEGH